MSGLNIAGELTIAQMSDSASRLATIFDAHYDRLYRLARRLTANVDDALDLVQETFLKAAHSLKSIPSGFRNEEAWLVRVLINTRRDQWRKAKIRKRDDITTTSERKVPEFEAALIARDTVWRALDSLSPRRRAIVVMHELEELTIPVIAHLLGITAVTVRWHLAAGRRDLTHALGTSGGHTK